MSDARPELNGSYVAWTVLRDLRDGNQKLADNADLLMQAIETAPELDAAMCITMGIKPRVPPGMGKSPSDGGTVAR